MYQKSLCFFLVFALVLLCNPGCGSAGPKVAASPHSPILEPDAVLKSRISRLYEGLTQEKVLDVLSRRPDSIEGDTWYFLFRSPVFAEHDSDLMHTGYAVIFNGNVIREIKGCYRKR